MQSSVLETAHHVFRNSQTNTGQQPKSRNTKQVKAKNRRLLGLSCAKLLEQHLKLQAGPLDTVLEAFAGVCN